MNRVRTRFSHVPPLSLSLSLSLASLPILIKPFKESDYILIQKTYQFKNVVNGLSNLRLAVNEKR